MGMLTLGVWGWLKALLPEPWLLYPLLAHWALRLWWGPSVSGQQVKDFLKIWLGSSLLYPDPEAQKIPQSPPAAPSIWALSPTHHWLP
jgi:hypothetical protein